MLDLTNGKITFTDADGKTTVGMSVEDSHTIGVVAQDPNGDLLLMMVDGVSGAGSLSKED